MSRNITEISQRGSYTPSRFTNLLWWLATAEKELLIHSIIDRTRYQIIGMSVLATWIFASLAWTYFFSTFMGSVIGACVLGIFMGLIILTIDRALIKGISKANKNNITALLFRGILAITIGTFMAQPAILYMFKDEISLQISIDNQEKKKQKRKELESFNKQEKAELLSLLAAAKNELALKYSEVARARENFLSETDGSGGTGKIGIKDIALAKKEEYKKLDQEYEHMLLTKQASIKNLEAGLSSVENKMREEEAKFASQFNDGFLTRIQALNNLLQNNRALQTRYYLILIILILIELMPVIAKSMLPSGSYEEKLRLREEMEIWLANQNRNREQALKELYNQGAFETDSEIINRFLVLSKNDREEKLKSLSLKWKEQDQQSFDSFWENIKNTILTKQEN